MLNGLQPPRTSVVGPKTEGHKDAPARKGIKVAADPHKQEEGGGGLGRGTPSPNPGLSDSEGASSAKLVGVPTRVSESRGVGSSSTEKAKKKT